MGETALEQSCDSDILPFEKVPSLCSLSFMNVSEAKSQGLLQQNIIEAVLESILISASLVGEKKLRILWQQVDYSLFISKKSQRLVHQEK